MDNLILRYSIITIVIIALILTIVFIYVRFNNKRLAKIIKAQSEQELSDFKCSIDEMNKNLIDALLDGFSEKQQNQPKGHQQELMSTFERLRAIIKDDLFSALNKTDARRVALYLLHNGTTSLGGIGFLKMSCIGERILPGSGIKEQIINHSNLPINIFDNMLEKLIENGRYVIMNDQETMLTARSQFISHPKIRYSQAIALYDTSNNILGFILAEYESIYTKENSDQEYRELKILANKLAPLLTYSDYSKLAVKNK